VRWAATSSRASLACAVRPEAFSEAPLSIGLEFLDAFAEGATDFRQLPDAKDDHDDHKDDCEFGDANSAWHGESSSNWIM
jgi:hypothetical protein